MSQNKRYAQWCTGLLATALVLMPAPAAFGEEPALSETDSGAVTLITGDRVRLVEGAAGWAVDIQPGEGREGMRFVTQRTAESMYVIPADAMRLVANGTVDRRLFDVPGLIEAGYHQRSSLPLIVEYARGAARAAGGGLESAGAEVTASLPAIGGAAVEVPTGQTDEVWAALTAGNNRRAASGVERVWLDGRRRLSLDVSVPAIGASAAWETGLTGEGVTVAVVDSGIDTTHPDLVGQVAASENFTFELDADDYSGHGTHVAATIAGTGAASDGAFRGVAPEATLLNAKACMFDGWCEESALLEAIQWAADAGADIINLSLGGPDTPEIDPLEEAINSLSATHGILFVVAAGNEGYHRQTVDSPASADAALAVGAVLDSGARAPFSAQGPRIGDGAIKPEITAPGVGIVAARARNGVNGEPVNEFYTDMAGTSMAAPHVAGAAALLAQQHPDWDGQQLKAGLMSAARPAANQTVFQQGAGLVDVAAAIALPVVASPSTVNLGAVPWPHHDDEPVSSTITYTNNGDEPITLALQLQVSGPAGSEVPDGLFHLSADEVTVPAGGTAEITVTADTRVGTADGIYQGHVVATAGDQRVVTPVAVEREPEYHNVDIEVIDHNGGVPADYAVYIADYATEEHWAFYEEDGSLTARLPVGTYALTAVIEDGGTKTAIIAQPRLEVTADTEIELDARDAEPVEITLARESAVLRRGGIDFNIGPDYGIAAWKTSESWEGVSTLQLGPDAPEGAHYYSSVRAEYIEPSSGDGRVVDTSYVYHLAWFERGGLATGFERHVRDQQLAAIDTTYRVQGEAPHGETVVYARPAGVADYRSWGVSLLTTLPTQRTEYFTVDGVEWTREFFQGVHQPEGNALATSATQYSGWTTYRAGRVSEEWNHGVFGPGFPASASVWQHATRSGDEARVLLALFSDGTLSHEGYSAIDTASTRLYLGDELIAEDSITRLEVDGLPAQEATYRLEASAERSVTDVSTRVSCVWTFRSGHTEEPHGLPLLAARFTPDLDDRNRAPAGRRFQVPVYVQRQAGAPSSPVASVTVEMSVDDGATWQPVQLRRRGDHWVATVTNPDSGFVSLRATVTDQAGNSVEQEIIRAYGVA